jgi:glycopeptide antibiotics resistance protein
MHIYVQNLSTLSIYAILILLAFTAVLYVTRNNVRLTKTISAILFFAASYGVLSYTVLGRMPSEEHTFVFATHNSESGREMFMNALLYYPIGLSLSIFLGPWSILVAFLSSTLIESWQYFTGSGLAQGTDVVMNMLGAAIGVLPCLIVKHVVKRQTAREQSGEQPEREKDKS